MANVPFYRKKFPKDNYMVHGDPVPITEEDLERLKDWTPIEKVKLDMWYESKEILDKRNKKREFLVTYKEAPEKITGGMLRREIEVLHLDYRGFTYTAEAWDEETLSRKFWPVVEALLAHLLSPKLRMPEKPPIPDGNSGITHEQDAINRFINSSS